MNKLTEFLDRNDACRDGLERLAATGAATPEEAWERADARDLVWAVTRPGVMSKMQRRKFLSEAVLAPIEHLLTDERSLIILRKLRTNEQIMQEDAAAARAAYAADADAADAACSAADASDAARAASWAAASAWAAAEAADAARAAAEAAADAAWAAAAEAAWAAAADAAAADADAAYAAAAAAEADAAAREKQARWIRDNFSIAYKNEGTISKAVKIKFCPMCGRKLEETEK